MKLEEQQEILSDLADMMISVFAMESALLRTQKLIDRSGEDKAKLAIQMTTVFMHEEFVKIENWAKEVLAAMESGDTLRTQLSVLKKLARKPPIDTLGIKREIAAKVIDSEAYVL
jgi:alkylation response protein AidB-like acyl-CoA dehydrogenase